MHDPGRIIVDLAVCVALGGGCLSDLAVLLRLMTTWDSSPARAVLSAHSPPPFGHYSRGSRRPGWGTIVSILVGRGTGGAGRDLRDSVQPARLSRGSLYVGEGGVQPLTSAAIAARAPAAVLILQDPGQVIEVRGPPRWSLKETRGS